jgi:predicted aspartyl protease
VTSPFLKKPIWISREPYLKCALSNPNSDFGSARLIEVKGLIDTGASVVLIPIYLARELSLTKIDSTTMQTAGSTHHGYVYDCRIMIQDLSLVEEIRVCAIKGNEMNAGPNSDPTVTILLGRSFLRRFHLNFDGPAHEFSLTLP